MKTLREINYDQVAEAQSAFTRWWGIRFRQSETKALSQEAFRAGYIACLKTAPKKNEE